MDTHPFWFCQDNSLNQCLTLWDSYCVWARVLCDLCEKIMQRHPERKTLKEDLQLHKSCIKCLIKLLLTWLSCVLSIASYPRPSSVCMSGCFAWVSVCLCFVFVFGCGVSVIKPTFNCIPGHWLLKDFSHLGFLIDLCIARQPHVLACPLAEQHKTTRTRMYICTHIVTTYSSLQHKAPLYLASSWHF